MTQRYAFPESPAVAGQESLVPIHVDRADLLRSTDELNARISDVLEENAGVIGGLVLSSETDWHGGETTAEKFCINADTIPWLRSVRVQARLEASSIMEANRQELRNGNFDQVPLDVDAVGTAQKVAAVREAFGEGSPEHIEARTGLLLDCSRKIAEVMRANTYEYFSEIEQAYVAATDTVFADGFSVDEMMLNGLSPVAEAGEADLRINDYVHLATNKALARSNHNQSGEAFLRSSMCPDYAIQAYRHDPKKAHGGYAPRIRKMMINVDRIVPGKIYHEQVGVSGIAFTLEVVNEAYQAIGMTQAGEHLSKTEIHATQGLVDAENMGGVLGFVRILDTIAGEKTGKNYFMGEEVAWDHPKDYVSVITEAEQRQKDQETLSRELADYVEELHGKNIEHALATVMVEDFIRDKLLGEAEANPDLAEIVFDHETAQGFREVQELKSVGRLEEAEQLIRQVRANAPDVMSCGGGSCGLELMDAFEDMAARELLDALPGEKTVKDKERPCVRCGQKEVVYAWSANNVKKGCMNCKATEGVDSAQEDDTGTKAAPENVEPIKFLRPQTGEVVTLEKGDDNKWHPLAA